ncbi:MAG: hypothetical protein V4505_17670 [Pseudomonadota bacterium]
MQPSMSGNMSGSARRGALEEISPSGTIADGALARRAGAVLHEAIAFRFKAHPRFLQAASFTWPSASWSFGGG